MKFNLRLSNQKLKNIFKGKGERKKVETQAKKEVKQRSGDTDVDYIKDKNETEKKAKYYQTEGIDEESE